MKRVTVVGAGTMGHGIAQVAALAGFDANSMQFIRTNQEQNASPGKFCNRATR